VAPSQAKGWVPWPGGWHRAELVTGMGMMAAAADVGRGHGVGSGGGELNFFLSVEGIVWRAGRERVGVDAKSSQMLIMARYICRFKCTKLSSSIQSTFLSADTEEYSPVIFLCTEEYIVIEECNLVSCSDCAPGNVFAFTPRERERKGKDDVALLDTFTPPF
jgi:hypothetical protein